MTVTKITEAAGASVPVDEAPVDETPADADRRAPGRPRSARADEAIIEAVLDLLAEGTSVETLSIEAVAARAGVGKATIYRRWPNKEALVIDAIGQIKGPPPEITGESIRADLIALLQPIGAAGSTRAARIVPCLVPEMQRNAELHRRYQQVIEPRRERIREVLRGGMADGHLRADLDVEVAVALLTAPMVVQAVLRWEPVLNIVKLPEQIVDAVLPGMLADQRAVGERQAARDR
jgi:AcrR family transcriptional regulator